MDKLRKYRKKLIIALTALLVLMLSISIVYGKYTSSRVSVVDLTVKHTVTLTLNANLPADKTGTEVNISSAPVVLSEQGTGSNAKVLYPSLPMDKILDSSNGVELSGYILDGWYLDSSCTEGKEVKAGQEITVLNEGGKPATEVTLYAKWKKNEPQEIGGEIFYMDPDVNGALYKFYKEDTAHKKVEINLSSVSSEDLLTTLKTQGAKYYLKVGSNSNTTGETAKDYKIDKFYVAALDSNAIHPTEEGKWGAASIEETADGIGKGKINTKSVMESIQEKSGSPVVISYPEGTIWWSLDKFINNDSKNNDWYIGSKEEMVKLHDYCGNKGYTHFDGFEWWTSSKIKYTDPGASKVSFWNLNEWDETDSSTVSYKAIPMRSF